MFDRLPVSTSHPTLQFASTLSHTFNQWTITFSDLDNFQLVSMSFERMKPVTLDWHAICVCVHLAFTSTNLHIFSITYHIHVAWPLSVTLAHSYKKWTQLDNPVSWLHYIWIPGIILPAHCGSWVGLRWGSVGLVLEKFCQSHVQIMYFLTSKYNHWIFIQGVHLHSQKILFGGGADLWLGTVSLPSPIRDVSAKANPVCGILWCQNVHRKSCEVWKMWNFTLNWWKYISKSNSSHVALSQHMLSLFVIHWTAQICFFKWIVSFLSFWHNSMHSFLILLLD